MTGRGKGEETGRAERVTPTWPHVGPDALEQARQARQAAHQPGQPGPGNFINIKLMIRLTLLVLVLSQNADRNMILMFIGLAVVGYLAVAGT